MRFNPERLLRARKEAGLSRRELERLTGVDQSTIQAWENSWRFPTLRKFLPVARVLGKPLEYFFDGD